MQIYVAVTPQESDGCLRCQVAHAVYRIGPDSVLLRRNPLPKEKGGLLLISDAQAPAVQMPGRLCEAVLRECGRRSAAGAVLDFEQAPRQDLLAFAAELQRSLVLKQLALYVPESYASAAPQAAVLIGTALSGGNLNERLREAAKQYGKRLALDVERVRMDFPLPCQSGKGIPLTASELEGLMEKHRPAIFFSPDLCARYFTYKSETGTRFVLFDDTETIRRKLRLGQEAGATVAFLMWPEVQDIAGELGLLRR